ncbi:alpha-2A adrenergic receptor-like [Acropora millepora]|uniref:alpha-2A adrenergic receptor-like n=1 Tax=Acropora millepora TaxID=45264 RepID=UPI001CF10082|nr:alpha-2A adrenergic receptor-like [Acropora millepora]
MNIANQSSTYVCSPEYSFTGDRTSSARILVGINVCFCFIAIVGNVMASMAIFSTRSFNLSYRCFLWSLTVAELIVALVCQPLLIALILAQLNSSCIPALQFTFRVIANFGLTASVGTVALIALNTCLYVCGKFNYTNTITSRKKMAIVVVWLIAGVICCVTFFSDLTFSTLLWIVISFPCYATVLYQVHLHQKNRSQSSHQNPAEQRNNDQNKNETPIWQVACGIITILLLLSFRWLPICLFNLLKLGKRFGLLYYTVVTMTLIPSALYPVVYCLSYHNYRRALKRVCSRINPFAVKHDNETEETPKGDVGQELQSSIESTTV